MAIDFMPPRAGASKQTYLATGNSSPQSGTTNQATSVVQWQGDVPGDMALVLGSPPVQVTDGAVIRDPAIALEAERNGIVYAFSADPVPQIVQCRLEYGSGAVTRKVVFDWRAGSYQLPQCNFVRVSVFLSVPFSENPTPANYVYSAALVRGALPSYDVPIATYYGVLDGLTFPVPTGAHAVEIGLADDQGTLIFSDGSTYYYDTTNNAFVPPLAPLRIMQVVMPGDAPLTWQWGPSIAGEPTTVRFLLGL